MICNRGRVLSIIKYISCVLYGSSMNFLQRANHDKMLIPTRLLISGANLQSVIRHLLHVSMLQCSPIPESIAVTKHQPLPPQTILPHDFRVANDKKQFRCSCQCHISSFVTHFAKHSHSPSNIVMDKLIIGSSETKYDDILLYSLIVFYGANVHIKEVSRAE